MVFGFATGAIGLESKEKTFLGKIIKYDKENAGTAIYARIVFNVHTTKASILGGPALRWGLWGLSPFTSNIVKVSFGNFKRMV